MCLWRSLTIYTPTPTLALHHLAATSTTILPASLPRAQPSPAPSPTQQVPPSCCFRQKTPDSPRHRTAHRNNNSPPVNELFEMYSFPGPLLTVYVFKLDAGVSVSRYRYSVNASVPSPWRALGSGHGDVPSFLVRRTPLSVFHPCPGQSPKARSHPTFTFTFSHLTDTLIQSDLQ